MVTVTLPLDLAGLAGSGSNDDRSWKPDDRFLRQLFLDRSSLNQSS
jgi:hypothetical protein